MAISGNGTFITIGNKQYPAKLRMYTVPIAHDALAGTTAFGTIQIDPSSPFIWTSTHITDTNDPNLVAPGLDGQYENLITVQDQANNYNFSNDFVPRSTFARDRAHGYQLPEPIAIAPNTRLGVTIRNPAAGMAAGTTQVTFIGYSVSM